jgi:hypothetical protein
MKFNNGPANHFGDLGHDGVSEASQSVHPMGNPISHSTHCGFSLPLLPAMVRPRPPSPRTASVSDIPGWALLFAVLREPLPFASPAVGVGHRATAVCKLIPVLLLVILAKSGPADDALGVGHKPDALAAVRGTNIGSCDNVPFAYIPDRGKRPDDSVERAACVMAKKPDGIFRHKEPWAEIRNNSEGFSPHPSLIARAFLLACMANWLARHASADEVNVPIRWISDRERPHVAPAGDVWPVLGQHAAGIGVDLDLPAALHARPLKAEVKATDPGKE